MKDPWSVPLMTHLHNCRDCRFAVPTCSLEGRKAETKYGKPMLGDVGGGHRSKEPHLVTAAWMVWSPIKPYTPMLRKRKRRGEEVWGYNEK